MRELRAKLGQPDIAMLVEELPALSGEQIRQLLDSMHHWFAATPVSS